MTESVRVSVLGAPAPAAPQSLNSLRSGWEPLRVLGADSAMSIALPAANPTRSQLYAPRGVLLDASPTGGIGATGSRPRTRVIAADTGNHRLLIWNDLPTGDGQDSDVVVGQPDPTAEGPQAGGRGPERGLHLPTGLTFAGGGAGSAGERVLLVADGWNHRVVAYDAALDIDDPEPIAVLGQSGVSAIEANRGGDPSASSFYWPFGVLWHDGWLWVTDTGNRRVLGWQGLPGLDGTPADRAADVVLGQPSPQHRDENRGGDVGPDTFRWPHAVAVVDGVLWVADAGNHRLLGWFLPLTGDRPADLVLGQQSLTGTVEMPHVPQGPARLRFPYSVVAAGQSLVVADTANNRILVWDDPPGATSTAGLQAGAPADAVLGQNSFDSAGENRWTAVTADSLCWPYGLSCVPDARYGEVLAVTDSGNNRIVLWHRQ